MLKKIGCIFVVMSKILLGASQVTDSSSIRLIPIPSQSFQEAKSQALTVWKICQGIIFYKKDDEISMVVANDMFFNSFHEKYSKSIDSLNALKGVSSELYATQKSEILPRLERDFYQWHQNNNWIRTALEEALSSKD